MEIVLGFFRGLSAFQWILIAGGCVLLWPTIQEQLSKLFKKDNGPDDPVPVPSPDEEVDEHTHDLTSLVCKWEQLCDACHEHELHEACDKLKEVFPMLIKSYEKNHA